MRFSLILATVGRIDKLGSFLDSLDAQRFRDFELIVVDQNPDDRVAPILEPFQEHFPILHLRSERGLSRARNKGLRYIKGEIVAFPDDDCWYFPDVLDRVADFFDQNIRVDGLTGRAVNENGEPYSLGWDKKAGLLNKSNLWSRGISFTIFLRASIFSRLGNFDETLGLGAGTPWGSGEETELLIRAVENGYKISYDPTLNVGHPESYKKINPSEIEKAHYYALGMGHVLRIRKYPIWFIVYMLFRSFVAILLALMQGRVMEANYHTRVFHGRLKGWLA